MPTGTNIDTVIAGASYGFKVSTPAYNMVDYTLTFAGTPFDFSNGGTRRETSDDILLAYLYQAWLHSAAKYAHDDILQSDGTVTGQVRVATNDDIMHARLKVESIGKPSYVVPGKPDLQPLGYVQFGWDNGKGRLQEITFVDQCFFPDGPKCNFFYIYLRKDVIARWYMYVRQPGGYPILRDHGNSINANANAWSGVGSTSNVLDNAVNDPGVNLTVPAVQGGIPNVVTHGPIVYDFANGSNTNISPGQYVKVMVALAAEVWENLAIKDKGFSSASGIAVKGADAKILSTSLMRNIAFKITNGKDAKDWVYGPTGPKYYGVCAPIYPFGYGERRWLNATSNVIFPEQPCIGVAWWLKPGVHGTLSYTSAVGIVSGITTSTGRVALADGVTSGLVR